MGKGQVTGQIFLYIAAVIVIGLIILFGYRMISSAGKISREAVSSDFQNSLTIDVNSLLGAYGSSTMKSYELPSDYSEICFVDVATITPTHLEGYPVIKSSVESGAPDNVFLFGRKKFGSFTITNIRIENFPGFYCVQPTGRIVELNLYSFGDTVTLKTGPSQKYCENAQDKDLCCGLDIVFGEGYKSQCVTHYNLCTEQCSGSSS